VSDRPLHVLYLCTGNSARSVLAEAFTNAAGGGRFRAFSAGSHPTGQVNPFALELLAAQRIDTADLRSKSWDEFARADAPALDFVFTVCDHAAGEVCPVWPGQPISAHWGVDDPAGFDGPDDAKRKRFFDVYQHLTHRIRLFLSLPLTALDRVSLQKRLDDIGHA
jgi:protein-tyrosine-phosphatase